MMFVWLFYTDIDIVCLFDTDIDTNTDIVCLLDTDIDNDCMIVCLALTFTMFVCLTQI